MPKLQVFSGDTTALPPEALLWLRRAAHAEGWRPIWRPRALDARILHDCVPGLSTGPGFELLGDARGPGWLAFRTGPGSPRDRLELQRLLEVTRRPWGLLALLPTDPAASARLVEQERDGACGRRLAAEAAELLLRPGPRRRRAVPGAAAVEAAAS